MTIRWRTDVPVGSRVELGDSRDTLLNVYVDTIPKTEHVVTVRNLNPATKYYYAVSSMSGRLAGGDAEHFFQTSPLPGSDGPFRIWVLGDSGTGGDGTGRAESVRDGYLVSPFAKKPDVWLMLGDNAYYVGTDQEFQRAVFDTYPATLRNTPLWSTLGNHETYTVGVPYFDIFTLPTAGEGGGVPSGTENYYSFDYGNVHFICLDSMVSSRQPGSAMLQWLEEDLATTTQKWIVAFWHHPPYSKGSHNSDLELELIEMRQYVLPVLEQGGVDLVLSGHSHSYERSFLIDGHYGDSATFTPGMKKDAGDGREGSDGAYGKDPAPHNGAVYVVAGTSGQVSGGAVDHPAMCVNLLTLGSLAIDVAGDRMDVKFLGVEGVLEDYFTINKAPLISITPEAAVAAEAGPTKGRVVVWRSRGIEQPVTVDLATGGTATVGADFSPLPQSVTLAAGVASALIEVTASPDTLAEGTETVRIQAAPGSLYRTHRDLSAAVVSILDPPQDAWKFRNFGLAANTPFIAGDLADPDHDGVPNLLERAFDTSPSDANSTPIVTCSDGEFLRIQFPKPPGTNDLTYTVQVSGDAQSWQNGSRYGMQTVPSNEFTTEVARNGEMITVRDNVPMNSASRRYIRLQVTRPGL
jgi:hypothetical protein